MTSEDVSYITYATSPREGTGNKITFTLFEEGNLLSGTRHITESGNRYEGDSNFAPLTSEEEMDVMSSGNEYDNELTMLEDIHGGIQYHLIINERKAGYKIYDRIKWGQEEWKGVFFSTQKMGNSLHKVFKDVVNEISQALTILGKSGS